MPIYEYRCQQCGVVVERFQHRSAEPLVHCDACGQDALEKIISATHFQLKGGGWYAQGYGASDSGTKSDSGSDASTTSKE